MKAFCCFAPKVFLFFVAAGTYRRSFCEFFSVAKVNGGMFINKPKEDAANIFCVCFEQPSLAYNRY